MFMMFIQSQWYFQGLQSQWYFQGSCYPVISSILPAKISIYIQYMLEKKPTIGHLYWLLFCLTGFTKQKRHSKTAERGCVCVCVHAHVSVCMCLSVVCVSVSARQGREQVWVFASSVLVQ